MREIKFRAWNKEISKMVYQDETYYFDNLYKYRGENKGYQGVLQTVSLSTLLSIKPKEVELMQYTGLTDKNGKEIYEGDVVKVICNFDRANMVVSYENCMFVLKTDDGIGYKQLGHMNNLEVIGNIYKEDSNE